ncbi:permease [Streptomyces olivaceiscleroticus]|uniref:Permease n=1 Tax=Streptomyces olivaceiscleroticus TaxID=68245 RepID=A0ABN1AAS5_9ACTN
MATAGTTTGLKTTGLRRRPTPRTPLEPRGRRVWWRLIRIGSAAGRGAPGDRLRFWALLAAAAAVAVVALGVAASVATYDGRAARGQARGPVLSDHRHAVALWREAFDAVGGTQHSVVYVEPLKSGATPPPGLSRWPAPGEAVLSPELARAGESDRIMSRYGRYAGTIGKAGLVSPSERLAYVRPAQPPHAAREMEQWLEISGFGRPFPMGESLHSRPLGQLLLALGVLTGVPALALLVVAARIRSRARDRRTGLLRALGGTWRHRALVTLGAAAVPVAAGTALAVLPLLPALCTDLRLPPTGYLLNSGDLRAAWPVLTGALAVSFVLTLVAVALLPRVDPHLDRDLDRAGKPTRPRTSPSATPRRPLIGGALGVALIAFSQYLIGTPALVAFLAGTVVMWAFLPSVAAVAIRRLGHGIAAGGSRAEHPGRLTGGRWTAEHPGSVVRLAVAMVIGLGLISQPQVWNSRLGDKAIAARATEARIGDRVVSVHSRDITPADITAFARALPAGSHVLTIDTSPDQPGPLLQGSCDTLRTLGLACSATPRPAASHDPRMIEIRDWYGQELRVRALKSPSEPQLDRLFGELLVVAESQGQKAAVEQAAYALVPAVNVETPGEIWLVGSAAKARLNNWVQLFGACGLALLLLAGAFSAAAEFARTRRAPASLTVLTASGSVYRSAALWHLTVPLLITTAAAGAVTAWHATFFVATLQGGSVPWGALAAALGGCALTAVTLGVLTGRAAERATRRGQPTAD